MHCDSPLRQNLPEQIRVPIIPFALNSGMTRIMQTFLGCRMEFASKQTLGVVMSKFEQLEVASVHEVNYDTITCTELEKLIESDSTARYLAVRAMLLRQFGDRTCKFCCEDFVRCKPKILRLIVRNDGLCANPNCPYGKPQTHPTVEEYEEALRDIYEEKWLRKQEEFERGLKAVMQGSLREDKVTAAKRIIKGELGCQVSVDDFLMSDDIPCLPSGACAIETCPFGFPNEHPTENEYREASRQLSAETRRAGAANFEI